MNCFPGPGVCLCPFRCGLRVFWFDIHQIQHIDILNLHLNYAQITPLVLYQPMLVSYQRCLVQYQSCLVLKVSWFRLTPKMLTPTIIPLVCYSRSRYHTFAKNDMSLFRCVPRAAVTATSATPHQTYLSFHACAFQCAGPPLKFSARKLWAWHPVGFFRWNSRSR